MRQILIHFMQRKRRPMPIHSEMCDLYPRLARYQQAQPFRARQ